MVTEVRTAATEAFASLAVTQQVLTDLGRQYAWPWWNVLLAQPTLRLLRDGTPVVAAVRELWSECGDQPASVGPVPWIPADSIANPLVRLPRQARQSGPRAVSWSVHQVWLEPTVVVGGTVDGVESLVQRSRDTARQWGLLLPRSEPFDVIVRVARHVVQLGFDSSGPHPGLFLPDVAADGPLNPRWLSEAAASIVLAAHRAPGVLGPAGITADLAEQMVPARDRGTPVGAAAAVRNLHWTTSLAHQLLRIIGRPAGWNGGLLTLASTGTMPGPIRTTEVRRAE